MSYPVCRGVTKLREEIVIANQASEKRIGEGSLEKPLWELYRSLISPDPFWEEQGIYGGYEWIQLMPGIWVSRRWEADIKVFNQLQSGRLKCGGACISEFLSMLQKSNVFIDKPSEESDKFRKDIIRVTEVPQYLKVYNRVKLWDTLAIYGWNDSIRSFMGVYADSFKQIMGTLDVPRYPGLKTVPECTLSKVSLYQCCIVSKDSPQYKQHISNWSNVVVI